MRFADAVLVMSATTIAPKIPLLAEKPLVCCMRAGVACFMMRRIIYFRFSNPQIER
jgi:hypothetical protein